MTDAQARMLLDSCRTFAKQFARVGDDWESVASDVWMELWQNDITTVDQKLVKRRLRSGRDLRVTPCLFLEDLTDYERRPINGTSELSLSICELQVLKMKLNGSTLERIRSELGLSRDVLAKVLINIREQVEKDVSSD